MMRGLARSAAFPNGEWILLLALAAEIALFAAIAPNFFTVGNFFEVVAAERRARAARDGADAGDRHAAGSTCRSGR